MVYRIDYDDGCEGDKRDVFIESITAQSDCTLRITSERGDSYLVDIARRTVLAPER